MSEQNDKLVVAHPWIKPALKKAGYRQRDLAEAWQVSDGAVSRFVTGHEMSDLPITRAMILAKMINMPLSKLAARLCRDIDSIKSENDYRPIRVRVRKKSA
jgi:predicted transcriptional regulator